MSFFETIRFSAVLLILTACQPAVKDGKAAENNSGTAVADSTKAAVIEFAEKEHDFGKVNEGERVGWYFKFKNTGGQNLIIHNASASCGCTISEYDQAPVRPGGEGYIKVIFDTQGRPGIQSKTITVESNAQNSIEVLSMKAEVVKE